MDLITETQKKSKQNFMCNEPHRNSKSLKPKLDMRKT